MMKPIILASLFVSGVCFADGNDSVATSRAVPSDGWRANVTIGAAEPATTKLGTGSSESAMYGFESMHGRLGVDLGLELEAQTYGSGWLVAGSNRVDVYSARPTVQLEFYGDRWLPHASLGAGYAYGTGTGTIDGMSVSGSDNFLALAATAGIDYRITDRIAVGPYVRYAADWEPALNQFVDFGISLAAH